MGDARTEAAIELAEAAVTLLHAAEPIGPEHQARRAYRADRETDPDVRYVQALMRYLRHRPPEASIGTKARV